MSIDIYGKLNNETVKKEYSGGKSDTANVIVNNETNTITAEVKKTPGKLVIQYDRDDEPERVFDGSEDVILDIPELGDFESLENRVDVAEQDISNLKAEDITLQQNIDNEETARINADTTLQNNINAEANARTSADNNLQTSINNVKNEAERINLEEDTQEKGKLIFTPAVGNPIKVQGGFLPDNDTLELNADNELTIKEVHTDNTITGKGTNSEPLSIQNSLNTKQNNLSVQGYLSLSNDTLSTNFSQKQDDAINSGITYGKIMDNTSAQNPLTNQEFVNSSIATNTANFIGTFNSVKELLNINILESGSIILAGSTIKEGSNINGSQTSQDGVLSNDLTITQTSFPNGGSIILTGSTIVQDSWINHSQYDSTTVTQEDITIETWTNNDYAFVTNNKDNPYEFNTYADLIAWSNPNLYLITNWDYAWTINQEDNTKFDLYRFDITTYTWGLRVSKTDKNAVTLNSAFNRYKYVENTVSWLFEFTLNNSSFTAQQWSAINSGINQQLVEKLENIGPLTTTEVHNITEEIFFPSSILDEQIDIGNN